tara:strand:+ start:434 stop:688 length:255 start_codon:yes stop_codon:yes gene_type:complete
MALTEETIEDKIEVVGDYKIVQVRTATVIKKDEVELTRSFHRHVVNPTDDTSGQSDEVKAICNVVHTDAIKEAYKKHLENQSGI